MRLYHRTSRGSARSIMAQGFRNAWGYYLTDQLWHGVWLSEAPTDQAEDVPDDIVLVVDLNLPDADLAQYAWVDLSTGRRDFLLPADLINRHATIQVPGVMARRHTNGPAQPR